MFGHISGAFVGIGLAASICTSPAFAGLTYSTEQTDGGITYIVVSGEFTYEDNLAQFTSIVRSYNVSGVTFHSPGGNITKAMEMGRLIRSLNLATVQPRAIECASSCTLAFMGGVMRFAEPGSLGVHKSSFSEGTAIDTQTAVSAIQQITADVMTFMLEMGVDPALLQVALQYESDDIRYLSKSEMERFRVTTGQGTGQQAEPSVAYVPPPVVEQPQIAAPVALPQPSLDLTIPDAHSGRIRHPKGSAPLKMMADGDSANVVNLRNGAVVQILGNSARWYRVKKGAHVGFMHDTWVHVDQYQSGAFEQRHIQIKSFDNYAEAEAFVRSSTLSLSIYLATNRWFAITLKDTYYQNAAKDLAKMLKDAGKIPDDSYVSYGNTYVRKLCCG
jgi:hypothetical protein